MRATRVLVPGALHERKVPVVEDVPQTVKARMQPERAAGRVSTHLQHLAGGNGDRWAAAVIRRVLVGDQRVQRIVAATEVDHDEPT